MAKMTDDTLLKHPSPTRMMLRSMSRPSARIVSRRCAIITGEPYPGDEALDGWSQIVTSEVQGHGGMDTVRTIGRVHHQR